MTRRNLSIGDRLQAEPYQVRRRVLELLDEMSAPMSPREIERALRQSRFWARDAKTLTAALKSLPIIAIGAGEP